MTEAGLQADVNEVIVKSFGTKEFEYAIFFGTPCADQKVTIQVSQGGRVLGYCKWSDSEIIGKKFQYETELLNELNGKGLTGIPKGLACGKTGKGLYYFAQSTTKSLRSSYPHEWGKRQERFLQDLYDRTSVTMAYEETDFCRAIEGLKQRLDWMDAEQGQIVGKAIHEAERHFGGKKAKWSVCHGDFTPWNTFVNDGQFFVFDWEYALRACPPQLDRLHWFTQVCIFENHYSTEQILKVYHKKFGYSDYFTYLCYLLITISIYVGREKNSDGVKNIALLDTWTGLIKGIMRQ